MGYVVLARKWRPATFADMTGQEHVVRTLANAIGQGRVAHAYLFCGPRGVGKTTAARLLARALNCVNGPTAEPCGKCAPCVEIAAGTAIDVQEIDGASNNSVEDVRQIRERVAYLPHRDRNKIYIIDEVHMLSGSAFNALLKTLEEPPPHVKFIFATTEPQKLPDTILSRCQRHNFRRISEAAMVKRLRQICDAEGIGVSDHGLAMIARQADGGMRDALSLLDQIFSTYGATPSDPDVAEALGTVDRTAVHGLCRALVNRDAKAMLALVDEQYTRGVELKTLAEEAAIYLRHLIVTRVQGTPPEELADVDRRAIAELAKETDVAQLARLFDLVHTAVTEVGRSSKPKLALEVAMLKAIHLAPSSSIPDLVARLEQISRGGAGSGGSAEGQGGRLTSVLPGRKEPMSSAADPVEAAPGAATPLPEPEAADSATEPPSEPPTPLVVDTSPGGCATQECVQAPAAPADSKTDSERWKDAIETVRAKRARVAISLSHGRLLDLGPSAALIGFTPDDSFHRAQVQKSKAEIEGLLAAYFGRPVALKIEQSAPTVTIRSPAEEAEATARAREQESLRLAREHPAVSAAVRLLGGNVEEIRLTDPDTSSLGSVREGDESVEEPV
jgi:DNA polymerase III subunit gamma/tau